MFNSSKNILEHLLGAKIIHFFLTVHDLQVHKGFVKGFVTTRILQKCHSIFICLYEICQNRSHGDVEPVYQTIRERLLVTVV